MAMAVAASPSASSKSLEGKSVAGTVRRTGRSARIDDFENAPGPIADMVQRVGLTASVGAPVIVDGKVWGVIITSWTSGGPPPPDTEARLAQFAELLDTAIANADSRAQLTASRLRMMAAEDGARRRVVRDLHDGAQQRLVQTILVLRLVQQALTRGQPVEALAAEALECAERGHEELRELAHGILPAALTESGLRAGVTTFARRLALPVTTELPATRFAPELEASAYFVIAEALTNVVKHSAGELRRGEGRGRRRQPEGRDPRRRHRRRRPRRPRPGRHRRPRDPARRVAADREPAGRRDDHHGGDPSRALRDARRRPGGPSAPPTKLRMPAALLGDR